MRRSKPFAWVVVLAIFFGAGLALFSWWLKPRPGSAGADASPQVSGTRTDQHRDKLERTSPGLRGGSIAGDVQDQDNAPVVGATVCVESRFNTERYCAVTDEDGRFELADLPDGPVAVTANAWGFSPMPGELGARHINVRADNPTARVSLRLRVGGVEIRGIVKDATGGVVEGALVRAGAAGQQDEQWTYGGSTVPTDEEGKFVLWADDDPWLVLEASAPSYATAKITALRRRTHPEYEFTLEPESTISGIVISPLDEPIAGAWVVIGTNITDPLDVAAPLRARTDERGRFTLSHLGPGRYKPEAVSGPCRGGSTRSIVLELGSHVSNVTIRVAKLGSVSVRLTGAAQACDGADLSVLDGNLHEFARTQVDEALATIEGLRPGPYNAVLECPGQRQLTDGRFAVRADEIVHLTLEIASVETC